jgi:hypothetical protein
MSRFMYGAIFIAMGFFAYLRKQECEREYFFGNRNATVKYNIYELGCALDAIKRHLGKDTQDAYHLIDVKSVIRNGEKMTIVLTSFNNTRFVTTHHQAEVEMGKGNMVPYRVTNMINNLVYYEERYLPNIETNHPYGVHDSERLDTVPFMNANITSLKRYTIQPKPTSYEEYNDEYLKRVLALYVSRHNKGGGDAQINDAAFRATLASMMNKDNKDNLKLETPEIIKYVVVDALRGM